MLLLGLFAVQHSVMARPGFKRWWTRIVPHPVERSTYVLLASLALVLLFWQWRPIAGVRLGRQPTRSARIALDALFALGWLIVLLSTFMINHFDLFGLRQVWLHVRGAALHRGALRHAEFYNFVRHPIMLGFLIAFWATPHMTHGPPAVRHRDHRLHPHRHLLRGARPRRAHGRSFEQYRRSVPMILPVPRKSEGDKRAVSAP